LNGQVGEQEEVLALLIILIKHRQTGGIQENLCEDATLIDDSNDMMIVILS
jgi:hypothetical protein